MKNLLLVDIGNTLIKIAMVNDSEVIVEWPVIVTKSKNIIRQLKQAFKINKEVPFTTAVISCVVPKLLLPIKKIIFAIYQVEPLVVDASLINKLPLKMKLENQQLGSDLIALSYAICMKYQNGIVVSLGTATTYSTIINSTLVGVIIGPGVTTSKNALITNAALLSDFKINHYPSMLGKNTNHALSIGYGYGFSAMIKAIVANIHNETNMRLPVILTGGNMLMLQSYFDFAFIAEPQILFWGLVAIAKQLLDDSNGNKN